MIQILTVKWHELRARDWAAYRNGTVLREGTQPTPHAAYDRGYIDGYKAAVAQVQS